jgi:hypothetical protein
VSMEPVTVPGRLARLRDELPVGMKAVTEFAVDNPGQVAVTLAGVLVAARVAGNLARPRTGLHAAALAIVMSTALPWLLRQAVKHDVISFRLRDGQGGFVSARELWEAIDSEDLLTPEHLLHCPPGETVREHYQHGGKLFDDAPGEHPA